MTADAMVTMADEHRPGPTMQAIVRGDVFDEKDLEDVENAISIITN
jgi:hypothetical protein